MWRSGGETCLQTIQRPALPRIYRLAIGRKYGLCNVRGDALAAGRKNRILIVEDEPDIATLMKHALERGGDLDVEIVGTGAAALKAVMEDPPGLVLLDLNLPFIDGLEVCRLLRSRAS